MSKLKGEEEILKAYPEAMILRVPVLYGQTEKTNESAVNVLIDTVRVGQSLIGLEVILIIEMKDSSKVITVDDYHIRYPTCVDDVARVLLEMTCKLLSVFLVNF
jgi:S-adenosylmethionine synthetase